MKRIAKTLIVFCLFAMPTVAFAQDQLGVYVGGHAGMSIEHFSSRKTTLSGLGSGSESFSTKNDEGFGGGIVLGYDFAPKLDVPIRVELDYTARAQMEAKSSMPLGGPFSLNRKDKITLQTLMLNAWVDIPTGTAFTPYLGGGLGMGFIEYNANHWFEFNGDKFLGGSGSKTESNFAWSLGGGLAYDITRNLTVDLGYRYIDAGKVKKTVNNIGDFGINIKSEVKVQVHDIMLGVRYTF